MYDEGTHSIYVFAGMTESNHVDAPRMLSDFWRYDICTHHTCISLRIRCIINKCFMFFLLVKSVQHVEAAED